MEESMNGNRPYRFSKKRFKQEKEENIELSFDEIFAFILLLIIVVLYALSEII